MARWLDNLLGREPRLVVGESVFVPDPYLHLSGKEDVQRLAEKLAETERGLDFTVQSQNALDSLIEQKRAALIKDPQGLDQPDLTDFVLSAGSYVAMCMLQANETLTIVTQTELAASQADSGLDFEDIQTAAAVQRPGGGLSFPYAKVIKFIENGPEDATFAFASFVLNSIAAQE